MTVKYMEGGVKLSKGRRAFVKPEFVIVYINSQAHLKAQSSALNNINMKYTISKNTLL